MNTQKGFMYIVLAIVMCIGGVAGYRRYTYEKTLGYVREVYEKEIKPEMISKADAATVLDLSELDFDENITLKRSETFWTASIHIDNYTCTSIDEDGSFNVTDEKKKIVNDELKKMADVLAHYYPEKKYEYKGKKIYFWFFENGIYSTMGAFYRFSVGGSQDTYNCSYDGYSKYKKAQDIKNNSSNRSGNASKYVDQSKSSPKKKESETVDPDDHDIEGYYEDNKNDFSSIDEAYDAFEDDEDAWDDY